MIAQDAVEDLHRRFKELHVSLEYRQQCANDLMTMDETLERHAGAAGDEEKEGFLSAQNKATLQTSYDAKRESVSSTCTASACRQHNSLAKLFMEKDVGTITAADFVALVLCDGVRGCAKPSSKYACFDGSCEQCGFTKRLSAFLGQCEKMTNISYHCWTKAAKDSNAYVTAFNAQVKYKCVLFFVTVGEQQEDKQRHVNLPHPLMSLRLFPGDES
jgi:hypothetical protein